MRTSPGSVDTTNIVDVCLSHGRVDQHLLREMLGYFVDENRRRMAQADDAMAANDRETLREIAHAVRGSAAMIGAGHLHHVAAMLEQEARAGDADDLKTAIISMQVEFSAVHKALRAQHPEAVSD